MVDLPMEGLNGVSNASVLRIWIAGWRDMLELMFKYVIVFSRPLVYFQLVKDLTVQM